MLLVKCSLDLRRSPRPSQAHPLHGEKGLLDCDAPSGRVARLVSGSDETRKEKKEAEE